MGYHDYILGEKMKSDKDLLRENIALREELIEKIKENIKILQEKNDVIDTLLKRDKETLAIIDEMQVAVKALGQIHLYGDLPWSAIAKDALKEIERRIEDRQKENKLIS